MPTATRKTVDVWEFWIHHPGGWECEAIELTRDEMRANRKAYREAGYNPTIRQRRVHRDKLQSHDPKSPR